MKREFRSGLDKAPGVYAVDLDASPNEVQRSYELLLKAQRIARTGYVISDVKSNRLYWSDSLFEQRKVPKREYFTREEGFAFIHPDDRPRYEAIRLAAVEKRMSFSTEMRVICGDGSIIWEKVDSEPQFDEEGNYTGLLAVVQDITESKRSATTLRDQETTYRTLFDGMGDAVLLANNGRFVECNTAVEEMFRCTRDQVIGQTPAFISPEFQPDGRRSSEKAPAMVAAALRGERQFFEWRHKRFDGTEFDAEVTLNRVDIPGETYFFGIVRDITARKAADAALKAAHDKFASAFETSADAMIVATAGEKAGTGIVLDVNKASERLFGKPRGMVIGKPLPESGFSVSAEAALDIRRKLDTFGEFHSHRATISSPGGGKIEAEISGSRFDLEGKPHALLIVRDVTENIATESRIHDLNHSLNASLKQLRDITDNLPVLVSHQDADGRFTFINKIGARWLGRPEKGLLGKTIEDIGDPDFIDMAHRMRAQRKEGKLNLEVIGRYPDGNIRAVDVTYVPDIDENGATKGFYAVSVDVSARRAAEEALKTAHDKFAGAFESSADAMIVAALASEAGQGTVVDVNPSAERILGLSRDEMIGRTAAELNVFPDLGDLGSIRRDLFRDTVLRGVQITLQRKDGTRFEAEISGSSFEIEGRLHSLLIIRDISERIEAERKIRKLNESLNASLKQLRDITDNLPVLISYQDANGRFEFINKTGEEWLALREGELIGKTVAEALPEEYVTATASLREERARTQNTFTRELTVRFPDGRTRTAEGTFIRDVDADGVHRGTYTISVDMTERRATEEQLRQSQKMQAIGKLTGGVAHDFNNLLAVILGNLELAIERLKGSDDPVRRLLAPALRAAERGATLTRSLLAFARRQPLDPTVVDVGGLVRDMTSLLRRTVPANIEIEFVNGAGLWKCEADPGQLQNALLNLIVNARDAMPEGGKLTIETGNVRLDDEYARNNQEVTPGQYVMIAVSDTGTGMSPEIVARVFEPFFTTKGIGQGTGLGLSMVYGFAKQSNGHVAIYSEIGHGTAVRIYLPRWIGSGLPTERTPMQAPGASGETVLVVEDDNDVRFVAVTMLRSLGYEVLEAAGGKAALDMLAGNGNIRLLLTDVMLAGAMNGRRVADEARTLNPELKVLYMSGYTENAIVHHGRLDPGVQFIQKPFRKHDLAIKVRQVLDEGKTSA